MDNAKDIQNSEGIVKFIDGQPIRTSPFGENKIGERAYRRVERIATALILLTNHVPEQEPLRKEIRHKTIHLLSFALNLRDELRSLNSERVREFKSTIRELISLVRLLAVSGLISFQNASVISEALDELSGFLVASQRSNLSESINFSREDFLDVRDKAYMVAHRGQRVSDTSRTDASIITDSKDNTKTTTVEKGMPSQGQATSSARNTRAQAIIGVLRLNGALGIRDISSNLPEYSEKMIQRELADMAASGMVKKTGSKRWSMYALV